MAAAIKRIHELRAAAGRTGPFTIGAFAPPGPPEKIAASIPKLEALGIDQVQVRFPSLDFGDLCRQIRRFGTLVNQPG
jgi:hypothetical protein